MPKRVPIAEPVLFPLWAVVDGKCGCGNDNCDKAGKHPAVKWGVLEHPTPEPTTPGYGLKTGAHPKGSGIVVVDADDVGAVAWVRGQGIPDTTTVRTGRGEQYYFQHPGFRVRPSSSEIHRKVDIKGDGGFVVGPGSPHRSGRTYELIKDCPPAPCPEWLLAWDGLRAKEPAPAADYAGDVTGETRDYHRALYADYLKSAPARGSDRRGKGDETLFYVVQRGAFDLSLPEADVLALIREHYDPRCEPPWGDELPERVRHKTQDAKTNPRREQQPPPTLNVAKMIGLWKDDNVTPKASARPPRLDRFDLVHASELATPVPPVEYVWRHFGIAPGRPSLLAGYGGAGKTIIVQCLALHMAAGKGDCWGLAVAPGGVVHIDYEMTLDPVKLRYQRLAEAYDIDLAACNLTVVSMPRIYLSSEAAEDALIEACDGKRVCIIDNLAAALGPTPIKENESGIRNYLDLLTRVSKATGCTFLVLVHERKASKEEGGSGLQRVRGSSAITDASGSVISISPAEDGIVTVSHTKTSHRKKGDDLCLKIEDCGTAPSEDEDAPGLRVVRTACQDVAEKREGLQGGILEYIRGKVVNSLDEICEEFHIGKGKAAAEVKALKGQQMLSKPDNERYLADTPALRRKRILEHARRPDSRTIDAVIKSADVTRGEVDNLMAEGCLYWDDQSKHFVVSV